MAVWYAGRAEADKSVGLKASWKPLNGGDWSKSILIHKTPDRADGNCVIAYYHNEVYLFFDTIFGSMFPWQRTLVFMKKSADYGRTWSEPRQLTTQKGFTLRNKPLIIGDRMIIPMGSEHIFGGWSQMLITEDGENFHLSGKIISPKGQNEQPTLVQLGDQSILGYLRTNINQITQSRSTDLGETWGAVTPTPLKNPNSALDFVRTQEGELILIWNNNTKAIGMAASRRCINVGYSPDEGHTWPIIKELERNDKDGHFAYPAIIIGSDGLFHVLYNNRRKNMQYCRFDVDWLKNPE
jgi:alpha-L-rhamnosidase